MTIDRSCIDNWFVFAANDTDSVDETIDLANAIFDRASKMEDDSRTIMCACFLIASKFNDNMKKHATPSRLIRLIRYDDLSIGKIIDMELRILINLDFQLMPLYNFG